MDVLDIQAAGRRFGDRWVVRNVNVSCAAQAAVGIVGENGSGKTTLLRMIAQLARPSEGVIRVGGHDVSGDEAAQARACVGFVPHVVSGWPSLTVADNLATSGQLAGIDSAEARERTAEALSEWGLDAYAQTRLEALSRGWKQRFALARADLARPQLLLLDEPTTGLDDAGRELLDAALERWRSDRAVVVTSHERAWLADRVDDVVVLAASEALV